VELYNEAMECLEEGDNRAAVEKLVTAAGLTPDARDIYLSLIRACMNSGQTAILKTQLARAKQALGNDHAFCFALATIYQEENNLKLAIHEYTLAIDSRKKLPRETTENDGNSLAAYYMYRGNCYLKRDEFARAIADYTDCLALDGATGAVHANRGIAYFKTGKPFLACADWKKARDLGITSVRPYITKYCK
jgi:tetratricopeptide (TPR) repeat protein